MKLRDRLNRLLGGGASPRAMAGEAVVYTSLDDPGVADLLRGGTASGAGPVITPVRAMQSAAVFRSVNLISCAMGSMPAQLFEEDAGDERIKRKAKEHPLYWLIYLEPNPRMGSFEFRRMMEAHVLLRGNAYAYLVKGSRGYAQQIWPLHPDRTEPLEREDLSIVYRYTRRDGTQVLFEASDILHLRDISTDGIKGLSRIDQARNAIGLSLKAEEYGSTSLKKGGSLGGVLATPKTLSDKAYERLKQSMAEKYSGAENAGDWLLAEEGLVPHALTMTHADAQFLESRRYQAAEIAGMFFGIPPHLMGDSKETNWGTGIEQQNIGFHQFTLLPETRMWEDALNRTLLKQEDRGHYFFKFNASAFMRASAKDRGLYYAQALGSGGSQAWMVPNEVRDLEELGPVAGGDVLPPRAGIAKDKKDEADDADA